MSDTEARERAQSVCWRFPTEGEGPEAEIILPRAPVGSPRVQRLRRVLRRALWFSRHRQGE
jgi:hypothetical protein